MKNRNLSLPAKVLVCALAWFLPANAPAQSNSLQRVVDSTVNTTLTKFADKKLREPELAITLIDLRDAQHPVIASFRGRQVVSEGDPPFVSWVGTHLGTIARQVRGFGRCLAGSVESPEPGAPRRRRRTS